MIMRNWLCLTALAAVLAVATPAAAGSIEEAEALFNTGQQFYNAAKYAEALDSFQKAYSTYPKARYVFFISKSYEALGEWPKALDALELFTEYEPTEEILNKVKAEVARLKAELARDYGEVFIFSSPSEARVFIGEISKHNLKTTPTRRWLKDGEHTVLFQMDGYKPREMKVQVKRGEHVYIYAGLQPQ